ncbi:hypothetical protein K3740_08740 [Ruegeria conchae]|uniref:hypothetical protein n=1 Tax=Ruegeria conchae TaxID=981384 RepID=UPI0021A3595B|nr:hypothetical protein [Ruegeria conchae]UWR04747.1 hypothetical protein K3740_08740 [Ruegeria conchae]
MNLKIYNRYGQHVRDLHNTVTMRREADPQREGMSKVYVGTRMIGWMKDGDEARPHPVAQGSNVMMDYTTQETP